MPAVASGEEAYSLAMLIDDAFRQAGARRLPHLRHRRPPPLAGGGRRRLLPGRESLVHVPAELRDRYFERHGDGYQVSSDMRGHIVFAPPQRCCGTRPSPALDLVSCRNFLIYLKPPAQRRVLALFHFASQDRGRDAAGAQRDPGPLAEEFSVLDSRWKLFRKCATSASPT